MRCAAPTGSICDPLILIKRGNMKMNLEEQIEALNRKIRDDYSGRGMFGRNCYGIECNDPIPCIEQAAMQGISGANYCNTSFTGRESETISEFFFRHRAGCFSIKPKTLNSPMFLCIQMTLEDICKDKMVRGRLSNVSKKLERLEFLLECKEVELTIFKSGSRLYMEIQKEIKVIQTKLDELKRQGLLSVGIREIPGEGIIR
jgi:hypothetical protein